MTCINLVAGLVFDQGYRIIERIWLKIQLRAADPANKMMVIMAGQFVSQVTTTDLGGMDNAVPGQEFQRAVHGCFRHADRVDALIDLPGRKMSTFMQGLHYG